MTPYRQRQWIPFAISAALHILLVALALRLSRVPPAEKEENKSARPDAPKREVQMIYLSPPPASRPPPPPPVTPPPPGATAGHSAATSGHRTTAEGGADHSGAGRERAARGEALGGTRPGRRETAGA